MYGVLLENLADFVKVGYGEEAWEAIRRRAQVDSPSFSTHQVYPETLMPRLAAAACQILNCTEQEFFENMGIFFVGFVGKYGYDRVLSVLGRHVRDFLNGLDNLHEYLKFSYPRMSPPSFFCDSEYAGGMLLHYRSRRKGYGFYAMGQIKQVARHFYDTEMQIELIKEDVFMDSFHVTFQLTFDNQAFREFGSCHLVRDEQSLPMRPNIIFELFPFAIAFTSDLTVKNLGQSIMTILPQLIGGKLHEWFDLVRPIVEFSFTGILLRTNNIFELVSIDGPSRLHSPTGGDSNHLWQVNDDNAKKMVSIDGPSRLHSPNGGDSNNLWQVNDDNAKKMVSIDGPSRLHSPNGGDSNHLWQVNDDNAKKMSLRLKGQMMYLSEWKMLLFLGTPVMPDLEAMVQTGLFINDLSMHDFSRDLMLAGTQQSVELKLALDQEQLKSKKLEESMKKLDDEMRRTDELLYQMIPKEVANRLRKGANPVDTCEVFDSVTILFSDVVNFTEICSRISPMQVVCMLNSMYSIFDQLTEFNLVYKVETIGDSYMVVSGAPEKRINHAECICDMTLDMLDGIKGLTDPSTGDHIQIRVGVHSGTVVGGVVGLKMPRYCLFGDTVNTASRMESNSQAMQIHVSETTMRRLGPAYHTVQRGGIQVKGKGNMKTYWLEYKSGRQSLSERMQLEDGVMTSGSHSGSDLRSYTPAGQGWRLDRTGSEVASTGSVGSIRASDLLTFDESRVSDIKQQRSRSPVLCVGTCRAVRAHSVSSATLFDEQARPLPATATFSLNDLSRTLPAAAGPVRPDQSSSAGHTTDGNLDGDQDKPGYSKAVDDPVISPSCWRASSGGRRHSAICALM